MDITFSAKATNPGDQICLNSTGVGAANLKYPDVVPQTTDVGDNKPAECKAGADSVKSSIGIMAAAVVAGVVVLIA